MCDVFKATKEGKEDVRQQHQCLKDTKTGHNRTIASQGRVKQIRQTKI